MKAKSEAAEGTNPQHEPCHEDLREQKSDPRERCGRASPSTRVRRIISTLPQVHRQREGSEVRTDLVSNHVSFQNHQTASSLAQGGCKRADLPYIMSGRTGQNCAAACGTVSPSDASSWVRISTCRRMRKPMDRPGRPLPQGNAERTATGSVHSACRAQICCHVSKIKAWGSK